MPIQSKHAVIEFATLGGAAGYIGAAGIARLEERKSRRFSWQSHVLRFSNSPLIVGSSSNCLCNPVRTT